MEYNVEEHKFRRYSLCNFLQPLTTYTLVAPNIPLSNQLSSTPTLSALFTVRDQVPRPFKPRGIRSFEKRLQSEHEGVTDHMG
jgi:hypothetical protein